MKKIVLTALLYSKKNMDLSYRLRGLCKRYSFNLLNAIDFVELTIKSLELKPQIVFCDCSTIEVTSGNFNAFLEKEEFKNTTIVFVGDDKTLLQYKNIVCKNLILANFYEIESIIDNLQNQYNFKNIVNMDLEVYNGLELEIVKLLSNIGLSPKHSGYAYLRCAIKNVVQNNGIMNSLNSEQYPIIASIFKTSSANVERNIRNAIDSAWKDFGKNNWQEYFYLNTAKKDKKPTNREFIFMCSEIILSKFKTQKAYA